MQGATVLGVVHNCQHFHERTQCTLFCDPLPPSQKRTLKMLIQNGRGHKPTFEISPRRCMPTFAKYNC